MELWIVSMALWLALVLLVVRARLGKTVRARARAIAFRPTEPVSADELFGLLLSANLAVLEHDDFNQLGSALGARRVKSILVDHWGVASGSGCLRVLEQRVSWLGVVSPEEDAAYTAWRHGSTIESQDYEALRATCRFLAMEAGVVELRRIRGVHLTPMAFDIQQAAYVARLGYSAGYLSREHAGEVLARLQWVARMHYTSWEDFSVSALVGMGVRSQFDAFDAGDWHRIAQSHLVLRAAGGFTLARAAGWADGSAAFPSSRQVEERPFDVVAAQVTD